MLDDDGMKGRPIQKSVSYFKLTLFFEIFMNYCVTPILLTKALVVGFPSRVVECTIETIVS